MAHVFEDIAELILQRLKDATFTEPYVIREFVRPSFLGVNFQFDHLKCVVIQDPPTRNPAYDIPGNPPALGWTVPYRVETFIRPSTTNPTQVPLGTVANAVLTQVIAALTTPASSWHTWDNLAPNTTYDTAVLQNEDGSVVTARVTLNVDCRHNEQDTTVAR